jgi:hypothetical protein
MEELLELVRPYLVELVGALTAAAVTLIRIWIQRKVALAAAEKQEREGNGLPGVEKKAKAIEHVSSTLPPGVRPFTRSGLDKLVEDAVPEARKRVSDSPPE